MENNMNDGGPVVVERVLKASVNKVWQALTNVDQMRQWYFNVSDFKPEVGFEFEFTGIGTENETYVHKCIVKEVIQYKKLAYTWRYEGFEGDSLVTFELFEEADFTRVKITHSGLDTFPKQNAFARSNFNFGWTHILNHQLTDFVE